MAGRIAACVGGHSDLRLEHGALIFPMPVEYYDRLMDGKCLPRGASYNGLRRAMEVDAVPNGRYHDPRAATVFNLLQGLRRESGVRAYVGMTAPLEGSGGDRRHPDAQLFVSAAKLAGLRTASRQAPTPDLVVEIDTTPLGRERERVRLAAYSRLSVPEVWIWRRTGGTEAEPEGRGRLLVAAVDGYENVAESVIVPGLVPLDLEELLREPDDLARDEQSEHLARRLAPAFARRWAVPSA